MRAALVVPSCRPAQLGEFLAAWRPADTFDAVYVLDGSESQDIEAPGCRVLRFADIDADLGDDAWVISRHDSARRCYGYLLAYRSGADLITTLDDDTRPVPGRDWLAEHRRNLDETPRWQSSVPGLTPRGMPYKDRGRLDDVMLSMGLWCGVPDQDAIHQLAAPITGYVPPEGSWVMPEAAYWPLCGMNLAFRREAAPLMYFGLQGRPWPFGRFDDIWCGVVAQSIMRHLGWHAVVGRPWVRHERASDPLRNLAVEAPGVRLNETFWRLIDGIGLAGRDAAQCMAGIGRGLRSACGRDDTYLFRLGSAIETWAGLFGD